MAQWIRSHAKGKTLNVTARAADQLGIPRAHAWGLLNLLWGWLSERSDDGSILPFTPAEIEDAAGWTGEPGRFYDFVRQRHVDAKGRIKEWDEYMGPLVRQRRMARDRQRSRRDKLRELQDADADKNGFDPGQNGSPRHVENSVDNSVDNSVTRDIHGRFTVNRDTRQVTRDRSIVTRDKAEITRDELTRIELRKSIRTTGMYLSRELDLVSSEGSDEIAIKPSRQNSTYRDAYSELSGVALVRAFCRRFYTGRDAAMLDSLQRLRALLRPAGVRFQGETVRATPDILSAAMRDTLASPPAIDDAAIVFVVKKCQSGPLHEVRTQAGEYVTEAAANEGKRMTRDALSITTGLLGPLDQLVKSMPTKQSVTQRDRDEMLHALRAFDPSGARSEFS
jgi:hypothetical protein